MSVIETRGVCWSMCLFIYLFIYINIVSSCFIHYIFVGEGRSITAQMVKCTRSHSLIVLQAKKYLDFSNSVNKCC